MIDYFVNDNDVIVKFPGFAFPISLSSFNRMLTYYIDKHLDNKGGN